MVWIGYHLTHTTSKEPIDQWPNGTLTHWKTSFHSFSNKGHKTDIFHG
jgi:hypothetical protein